VAQASRANLSARLLLLIEKKDRRLGLSESPAHLAGKLWERMHGYWELQKRVSPAAETVPPLGCSHYCLSPFSANFRKA